MRPRLLEVELEGLDDEVFFFFGKCHVTGRRRGRQAPRKVRIQYRRIEGKGGCTDAHRVFRAVER